jgi:ParB family chromosome partitioning protein
MTTRIALSRITADPNQPRKKFDETALNELAASIHQNGLIQSITVRPAGKGKRGFIIVAGERRWRSHKILVARGLKAFASIECHVQKKGAAAADTRVKQIAENLTRENLEPMEEARAFASLKEEFGFDDDQIAKRLGLAPFRVTWRLSLLNLSPPIAKMVESGQIDRQLALEAARLPDHRQQTQLVQMVNRGQVAGWGAIRNAVGTMLDGTTAEDLFGTDAPRASAADVATVESMEQRIERVAGVLARGWRDGECIIACKVSPDRATHLADRIAGMKSALAHMERELRNAAGQATIVLRAS